MCPTHTPARRPARLRVGVPIACVLVAAAVAAGAVIIATRSGHRSSAVAAGPSAGATAPAGPSVSPSAEPPTGPLSVRFAFDAGPEAAIVDTTGAYALHEVAAAGGVTSLVPRDGGWALAFPPRCTEQARTPSPPSTPTGPAVPFGGGCPRAILESDRRPELNPGARTVTFGAALLMSPVDTAPGANVVQKGFSTGATTQYKLQVDGAAGQPSCVVASATHIYRVTAPVGVADGRWHAVECRRVGGELSITVDGQSLGKVAVPPDLSIVNGEPIRIGGKGVGADNDQFAGLIDDVYVSID
jgi:hypothetical protein